MISGEFLHITMDGLAALVRDARRLVVIAAPGIDDALASAIVLAAKSLGTHNVRVILDVDEENCRAGYGNIDGYVTLIDNDVPIRSCRGLRIGFALADDEGYIFAMPPLMVEAPSKLKNCPNAIRATREQIKALEDATHPPSGSAMASNKVQSVPPPAHSSDQVEIGKTYVDKDEVRKIEENIRNNPVQDFDLSRVVNVFNAVVQFVEFSVDGTNLEAHTVKLPPELLTIVRDKKTRDRINAGFRMVPDNSRISGDKIRVMANDIRKRFIRTNETYGGIILKAKKQALEAEISKLTDEVESYKDTVRDRFHKEAEKSKTDLVQAFWRAVRESPPLELLDQISSPKPSTEEAKAYLRAKLDRAFPDVEKLCERMKVTFVTKDVTWETLNSPTFVDWLLEEFPFNKELAKPFQEYRAARQRPAATANLSGAPTRRA